MDETKPWYQSKTIWGSFVAALATGLHIFKIDIADLAPQLLDGILSTVTFIGVIVALYGRITAKKLITASKVVVAALLILSLTSCATGPVYPGSPTARTATGFESLAAEAISDYATVKAGNVNMTWALSEAFNAYQNIAHTAGDVKAIAAAWTGNTGDSKKLADRLARIFNASPAVSAADKTAAIAQAAATVASVQSSSSNVGTIRHE